MALDELLTRILSAITRQNELHIATANGDEVRVREILNDHPELAEELDSQKSSPLHIAAARGDENITTLLLEQAPNMCWSRDCHGMNPVHVAAAKGHVDLLLVLVREKPFAALEKLDRGETALHLCVKHGHLDALMALMENLGKLINGVEDNNGETLLHWAVRYQINVEIVYYLMNSSEINEKSRNSKGQKAVDLLKQSPWYIQRDLRALRIEMLLKSRSTLRSFMQRLRDPPKQDLRSRRDSIIVVAILIATMAYQAIISPPGGVWQDDDTPHKAGESVLAFNNPTKYRYFMHYNMLAFITSLSTILLLISGLPSNYRIFMWTLTVIMWISVAAIAVTYTASVLVVTPRRQRPSLSHLVTVGIVYLLIIIMIVFILKSGRIWKLWAGRR